MDDTKKTGPRDVFGHLLAIIFLYVSIFSFGAIVFSLIDFLYPDVLSDSLYIREGLRWPLAVLVIVFPLYVWLTWFLQKDLVINPEKIQLKTRKWLLYFTLFATAIAIVIDLVSVLYQFLNGEITMHFVFKALSVLAIAGAVITYYQWNLRKGTPALRDTRMKIFVFGVIAVVIFVVIGGFVVTGSPMEQRKRRFDNDRVNDIQTVRQEVTSYWQLKGKLPASLSDLRNDIQGYVPPQDPETAQPYEYSVKAPLSFELCATFSASNKDGLGSPTTYPMDGYENMMMHEAGRQCFSYTIDPDMFPPVKKNPTPVQ